MKKLEGNIKQHFPIGHVAPKMNFQGDWTSERFFNILNESSVVFQFPS